MGSGGSVGVRVPNMSAPPTVNLLSALIFSAQNFSAQNFSSQNFSAHRLRYISSGV